jgi:hypothetical protein
VFAAGSSDRAWWQAKGAVCAHSARRPFPRGSAEERQAARVASASAVQDAYGCTLAAVTAADLGEGWVRWDCDWPGCSEHLRFWAPLGDPEREGWAVHMAVTGERQDAELAPRHYCPAHANGP